MSAPMPGWYPVVSGGYMNQPPAGAALKKIDPQRKMPPNANPQKPYADSRGKGRSRAPSICGSRRIETASKIGTAKRNIMMEPCSVNTWLYSSAERKSLPGIASWIRMSSARTPPNRKNTHAAPMYQGPTRVLLTSEK
jgi:hypothetical protein